MKDVSNIFKLPPEELEAKKSSLENLWDDTAPEIAKFAHDLQDFLKKVDTPYVLGLDGGYGTGKTHFATRFCAQMHPEIMTLYFSAWEKDYNNNPMQTFVEMITHLVKKEQENLKGECIALAARAIRSLWEATDITLSFAIPKFPITGTINVKKFLEGLKKTVLPTDAVQKAKQDLAHLIRLLPNQKLVFVVDDLDRCRPDMAVKTLEIIKHFFDIDGLIIIIPVGKERLIKYINAFYGLPTDSKSDKEEYLQKFFNDTVSIPELNYLKICQDKITSTEFTQNLVYKGDAYNSITVLQKWLAYYSQAAKLSYRETAAIIKRAKTFCNHYQEPIRCRLLAYSLCNNVYNKKTTSLGGARDLNFGDNNIYADSQQNPKTKVFASHPTKNALALINSHYGSMVIGNKLNILYNMASREANTYPERYKLIKILKKKVAEIDPNTLSNNQYGRAHIVPIFNKIIPELDAQKAEMDKLQQLHGSDDDDLERLKYYQDLVQNPQHI